MTEFTEHEKTFINMLVRGVPPKVAARTLGMEHTQGIELANRQEIHDAVISMRNLYTEKLFGDEFQIDFTRSDAALMYLEAHRKAATSTEEIKAADSLVKLFGLAVPEKKEIAVKHGSVEEFEGLDTQKLIEMSGTDILLSPEDYDVSDTE